MSMPMVESVWGVHLHHLARLSSYAKGGPSGGGSVGEAVSLPPEGPAGAVALRDLRRCFGLLVAIGYAVLQGRAPPPGEHMPSRRKAPSPGVWGAVYLLQGEGEVALQVSVRGDEGQGEVVGVRVHVQGGDAFSFVGHVGIGSLVQVMWA